MKSLIKNINKRIPYFLVNLLMVIGITHCCNYFMNLVFCCIVAVPIIVGLRVWEWHNNER